MQATQPDSMSVLIIYVLYCDINFSVDGGWELV